MGKKSTRKKQQRQQARVQPQVHQAPLSYSSHSFVAQAPTQAPARAGLELGEQFVRRDIFRTLVLIGVVAAFLIGLIILDARTSLVEQWATSLTRLLRLQ